MSDLENWSELYSNRLAVSKRYRSIWDVPIVKKQMVRLFANIKQDTRVLEVGAGDRRYETKIRQRYPDLYYRSMDIDKKTRQDYYDLKDIDEEFDFAYMFEVIEHQELKAALALLKEVRKKIRKGGKLLLSTPNLYHPHQYFGDSTHKTFFKFEELGGLMLMAGFDNIRVFRIYNDAFLRKIFRMYVGVWLHKYLKIDFAGTILIEGENVKGNE